MAATTMLDREEQVKIKFSAAANDLAVVIKRIEFHSAEATER